MSLILFFFNDTATTEIYTLSLHDALPISHLKSSMSQILSQAGESLPANKLGAWGRCINCFRPLGFLSVQAASGWKARSEEHTSELQSRQYLVCRLLLEKKNKAQQSRKSIA